MTPNAAPVLAADDVYRDRRGGVANNRAAPRSAGAR
jgi:hypothetical protein